MINFSILEK